MQAIEQATTYFQSGFNCSQAVCTAFAEELGVAKNTALRAAAGFGGGIGRMADTCGAVTGAIMVLGLKYGPIAPGAEGKAQMYEYVRIFVEQFRARHQSIVCRELLQCDISTPAGRAQAHQDHVFTTQCPKFIHDAAEILTEMLK